MLKNVKGSLNKITKSFEASHQAREYLIKNTRDIVILCSQSIIAVHKGDLRLARKNVFMAKKLLTKYKKSANGDLVRYLVTPEQEIVEATSLISIVEGKPIPSVESIGVSDESYILGLLDCIGELKRLIYDKIRMGKTSESVRFFEIMENLYLILYPFATYDKIVKETRKKLDVNRILVEETRSALTEEIRRANLIDAINKIK
ncbi:MAG TPA: RNA-binding protein [Nitrosopumilaceae archaeon]|nr:RNA-binding protein [Nitrosopumilaceae archaeon]